MNSMSLKDKLKNIAIEKNVNFNTVLRLYMYDRFIERLAISRYKDNFILKGGFYLSTFFGIENRATMDIDTAIKNITFTKDNIKKIITEIINIDINDNCKIEILNIEDIRQEDEYGGYRVNLLIKLDNIREKFQIDLATGDPITPSEIVYKYSPILKDKEVKLWSYNMETVLAEKLETILNRVETNSRIRDYYDIYLIHNIYWDKINKNHFRNAVANTFKKRKFFGDILTIIEIIKNSDILKTRWNSYAKKYKYAEKISYEEVVQAVVEVTKIINMVNV